VAGAIGLSRAQAAMYDYLLRNGPATVADLEHLFQRDSVAEGLRHLEELGLVGAGQQSRAEWHVTEPSTALNGILLTEEREILQRYGDLVAARDWAAQAIAHGSAGKIDDSRGSIELVSATDAATTLWDRLQRSAKEEVAGLDRPPYQVRVPGANPVELEQLTKGTVKYRGIYARAALAVTGYLDAILQLVAAGEQARVLEDVPLKLSIFDRRAAITPLRTTPKSLSPWLLIHPSALLDALNTLFELLWVRATPLVSRETFRGTEAPEGLNFTTEDFKIVALLSAGYKDAAIAAQLGIAHRTVVRRVANIMRELSADTRLQAGIQLAKHGYV